MHRSHWDLEVHAKDLQARRLHEAKQRRLAEEAAIAGCGAAGSFGAKVGRLIHAVRSKVGSGRGPEPRRPVAKPGATAAFEAPYLSRPPRARLAQPYADMVIVARGPMAGVTEQPSGVCDR